MVAGGEWRAGGGRCGGHAAGFRGARLALFQLETPLDTVAGALALARQEGLTTMLDPAPAQPLSPELLAQVDILTPNESEALGLLGRPPARVSPAEAIEMAEALRRMGPKTVIVKLGDQGCLSHDGTTPAHIAGFAVEVRTRPPPEIRLTRRWRCRWRKARPSRTRCVSRTRRRRFR